MAKSSTESWVSRFRSQSRPALPMQPLPQRNDDLDRLIESKHVIDRHTSQLETENSPANNILRHAVSALIKLENKAVNRYMHITYRERKELQALLPMEAMYACEDKIAHDKTTLITPLKDLDTQLNDVMKQSRLGNNNFLTQLVESKQIIEANMLQQENPSPYHAMFRTLTATMSALITQEEALMPHRRNLRRESTVAASVHAPEIALLQALPATIHALNIDKQTIENEAEAERAKFNSEDRKLFEILHKSDAYSEEDKQHLTGRYKAILAAREPDMRNLRVSDAALTATKLHEVDVALSSLKGLSKSLERTSATGDFASSEGSLAIRAPLLSKHAKAIASNHTIPDDLKEAFSRIPKEIAYYRQKHGFHPKHVASRRSAIQAEEGHIPESSIQRAAKALSKAIEGAYPIIQKSYDKVLNLFDGAANQAPIDKQISDRSQKIQILLTNLEDIKGDLKALEKPAKKQDTLKLIKQISSKLALHEKTSSQYTIPPAVPVTVSTNSAVTEEEREHSRMQSDKLRDYDHVSKNSIKALEELNPAIRMLSHALAVHDPVRQLLNNPKASASLSTEQALELQKRNQRSLEASDRKRDIVKLDSEKLHVKITGIIGRIETELEKQGHNAVKPMGRQSAPLSEMEQKYAHDVSLSTIQEISSTLQQDQPTAVLLSPIDVAAGNKAVTLLGQADGIARPLNRVQMQSFTPGQIATRLEEHHENRRAIPNVPSTSSLHDIAPPHSPLHRQVTQTESRSPSQNKTHAQSLQQNPSFSARERVPSTPRKGDITTYINHASGGIARA